MRLTRLLYSYDEVVFTLYTKMIKKDMDECYFWIGELYYSGENIKDILLYYHKEFCGYTTFYFQEIYDTLESCIHLMLNLMQIIPTPELFLVRNEKKIFPTHRFSGKREVLLEKGIQYKKTMNISYYLNEEIKRNGLNKTIGKVEKIMNTKIDPHDILESIFEGIYISLPTNFILEDIDDKLLMIESRYLTTQPYKLLKERLYKICDSIGCFNIVQDYDREDVLLHWEYYTQGTPFWDALWEEYNVTFVNKKPIFTSDESLEMFYEIYGYELDEQSKETQDKGFVTINDCSIKQWLKNIQMY